MDALTILYLMAAASVMFLGAGVILDRWEQQEKDKEEIQTGLQIWDEIKAKMIEKIEEVDANKIEVGMTKREVPIDKREVPVCAKEVKDHESKVPNV